MHPSYKRLVRNTILWAAGRQTIPDSNYAPISPSTPTSIPAPSTPPSSRAETSSIHHAPSYKEQDKLQPGPGDLDVEIAPRPRPPWRRPPFQLKKNTRALFYKATRQPPLQRIRLERHHLLLAPPHP